jgi:ribonuclease III
MQLADFVIHNKLRFKNPALLQEALTHRSYINEHPDAGVDNERLEFLGDAILDFLAAELLYERTPPLREGDMTQLRSALVRADTLALLARDCKIGEALRMARGEETAGGRNRVTLLGDAFEAVLGAIYLDGGLAAARRWLAPKLKKHLDAVLRDALDKDARSRLQEIMQEREGITPVYEVIGETGPEHDKLFTVQVRVGERVVATGSGRSKQAAAQDAARNGLAGE